MLFIWVIWWTDDGITFIIIYSWAHMFLSNDNTEFVDAESKP